MHDFVQKHEETMMLIAHPACCESRGQQRCEMARLIHFPETGVRCPDDMQLSTKYGLVGTDFSKTTISGRRNICICVPNRQHESTEMASLYCDY